MSRDAAPNKITAANAGWRTQFRFRGSCHRPGVAEFCLGVMRLCFIIAALASVVVGCAMRSTEQQAAPYTPPITLTLQSIRATNDNCHIAVFEIKNVSDRDMWFTGDGCEHPVGAVQYKRATGRWEDFREGGGLCGMGLRRCRVAAHSSTLFSFRFWPDPAHPISFRVGVRLCAYEKPRPSIPNIIYWSEAVQPP